MSALKEQVGELMVNQKHMLEAIKYLNERIEDIIEKAKNKDNQVEKIIESHGKIDEIIVKNADDIRVLKKTKEKNAIAIKHIEEKIDIIDEELKRNEIIVKEKANKNEDKPEVVQEVVKSIKCNLCAETFIRFVDLEIHIKNYYEKHKAYQCDQCEKRFTLKWRLRKHMRLHTAKNVKPCYYFKNNKNCPFDEFGCKFLHVISLTGEEKEDKVNDINVDNLGNGSINEYNEEDEETKLNDTEIDDLDYSSMNESSLFKTSTPKKKRIQCSECINQSQCTDCFVRQTLKIGHRVHFSEGL